MRFKFRTLFLIVLICAFGLTALLNPTRQIEFIISIIASTLILVSLAFALGAEGKQRIQSTCCLLLPLAFYIGLEYEKIPFAFATTVSRGILEKTIANTKPNAAPDGSVIFQIESGRYLIRTPEKILREIGLDEIEEMGLLDHATSYMHVRSTDYLVGIYEDIVAIGVGLIGYVVSGIAFERRRQSAVYNPREQRDKREVAEP